jgi:GTP cyclohydrolase-4
MVVHNERDINNEKPPINLYIKRVGIVNVYLPTFSIRLGDNQILANTRVNAYIDLPAHYKGIHASRNYESIMDIFSEYVGKEMKIEELAINISRELLERHPYASSSEVHMKSLIIYAQKTPKTEKISYERASLIGRAIAKRYNDKIIVEKKIVGVEVAGITACPSAQRTLFDLIKKKRLIDKGIPDEVLNKMPKATHLQRAYARLLLELTPDYEVNALELIDIARESMSSKTYELLKREDEAEVILEALEKPLFAEDAIRNMAKRIVEELGDLPDDAIARFSIRSMESIHQHDLVAYLNCTIKQLKDIVGVLP